MVPGQGGAHIAVTFQSVSLLAANESAAVNLTAKPPEVKPPTCARSAAAGPSSKEHTERRHGGPVKAEMIEQFAE